MTRVMQRSREPSELVARLRSGDRSALEPLFEECRDRLRSFVEYRLGPGLRRVIDADDVLQETFLRSARSVASFEWLGGGSFLRWLRGIAANVIAEHARRERRRRTLRLDDDRLEAREVSPSRALRRRDRLERLREALESLSPEHRKVVRLARLERVPVAEIARRLNRSPNAVSLLLMRAIDSLKARFGDTDSLGLPREPLDLESKEGEGG